MLLTRQEAVQQGLPRYVGKVCAAHPELNGERYTSSYGCILCALEAVKKYQSKNFDVVRVRNKQYRERNPEKIKQIYQDWRAANVDHDAQRKVKYRAANLAKVTESYRRYYKANYAKMLAKRNKQHADKLRRTPVWLTADDLWIIEQAYELARMRTNMFGFPWHVDHIFPLRGKKVCGFHVPQNLQVIPGVDNLRKSNRMEVE